MTSNAVTVSIKGMLAQAFGKGPLLPIPRRVGERTWERGFHLNKASR